MITVKEVENFYSNNIHLLGYKERIVLNGFNLKLETDRNNVGIYKLKSDNGSFEFAWDLIGYERGTVLS